MIDELNKRLPITVVLITLNEAHHLQSALDNVKDFASEVVVVDSYSTDNTVSIALENGARVVQREFRGFGDQWNFAISHTDITTPWTMKLDPDERLTPRLKESIGELISDKTIDGIFVRRRLLFLGRQLHVRQRILRVWRTGSCRFSDDLVNEYPIVNGACRTARGYLDHLDSQNIFRWVEKQNRYSSTEANRLAEGHGYVVQPRLLRSQLARRMWLKKNFHRIPARYLLLSCFNLIVNRAILDGREGRMWVASRNMVMRLREMKFYEMQNGADRGSSGIGAS